MKKTSIFKRILKTVTTLLEKLKGPVELGNPNTSAKAKLCLFLFIPDLGIVCCKTKVVQTSSSG